MYLVDFLKRLFRKSNIPIVIYLVINVLILAFGFKFIVGMFGVAGAALDNGESNGLLVLQYLYCFIFGIVVYGLCLFVALSPIGEFIIRLQNQCKKIQRKDQIDFIEPIFREVYERAKQVDPSIPDDVQLFMRADDSANAFATGRKTICITAGLLQRPVEEIKATIGHEFGHLAHKDTDLILIVSVGNILVNIVVWIIQALIAAFKIVSIATGNLIGATASGSPYALVGRWWGKLINGIAVAISTALTFIVVRLFFKGWTKLGFYLVRKSSRDNEYEADEFSFNCGYGDALCSLLASFGNSGVGDSEGLFAALAKSHPDSDSRISRLQNLGATFTTTYGGGTSPAAYQPVTMQVVNDNTPKVDNASVAAFGGVVVNSNFAPVNNEVKPAQSSVPNNVVSMVSSDKIKCQKCGTEMLKGARFCSTCGTEIKEVITKKICPECGQIAEEDDSLFCTCCGAKLNQ